MNCLNSFWDDRGQSGVSIAATKTFFKLFYFIITFPIETTESWKKSKLKTREAKINKKRSQPILQIDFNDFFLIINVHIKAAIAG